MWSLKAVFHKCLSIIIWHLPCLSFFCRVSFGWVYFGTEVFVKTEVPNSATLPRLDHMMTKDPFWQRLSANVHIVQCDTNRSGTAKHRRGRSQYNLPSYHTQHVFSLQRFNFVLFCRDARLTLQIKNVQHFKAQLVARPTMQTATWVITWIRPKFPCKLCFSQWKLII